MLKPVCTVAPAERPVTASLMRAQLRVDFPDEDVLIDHHIDAATSHLDGFHGVLGRAIVAQSWRQDFASFCDVMRLPIGDLISVQAVTYCPADGGAQATAPTSLYRAHTDSLGPYVTLADGQSWPDTATRDDAVSITWQCGYGAPADVPATVRHAVMLLAAHWFENREAVGISDAKEVPLTVSSLLASHRLVRV